VFRVDPITQPLPGLALIDDSAPSRVEIVPDRGGLVTRFQVGDREVLYLDEATLVDRSKNVRGGIPVLFPIAGRLAGDAYTIGDRTITMKQHGFARNAAWSVASTSTDKDARVTLSLAASDATRAVFPWDFEVRYTYVLEGSTLAIEQSFHNTSNEPMPLHAGFHPYFRVTDKDKANVRIATDATQAFDNTRGVTEPFEELELTRAEVDLHLLDHHLHPTKLELADGGAVRIDTDDNYRVLVIWTLAGKDFVCVEPWTAPGNSLNTRDGLIAIPPGGTHKTRVAFTFERAS
jgi:galactose mutarotase-like enzyme